jgi:hypothetical protein
VDIFCAERWLLDGKYNTIKKVPISWESAGIDISGVYVSKNVVICTSDNGFLIPESECISES